MTAKKVVVSGANGYLGSRLCSYLSDQGYRVTALCYPAVPEDKVWMKKMERTLCLDLRDDKKVEELAGTDAFDICIHLASLDHHQSNAAPAFVTSVNVGPTWSLLHYLSKAGLKHFIYFSTIHALGEIRSELIDEQTIPHPQSAYALTHYLGEELCAYYNRTSPVRCTAIRLSNSYGAPLFKDANCWWLVINDLCRMAVEKKEIVLQSDGSPLRDFIHGNDVVRAVQYIIEDKMMVNRQEDREVIHICSGRTRSILELAGMVQQVYAEKYGERLPIRTGEGKASRPKFYTLSPQRIVALGFQAEWSLERGIAELLDYCKTTFTDSI